MEQRAGSRFGDLLKHHRLAASLTQEELAGRGRQPLVCTAGLDWGLRIRPIEDSAA